MNIAELYEIFLKNRKIQTDTRIIETGDLFFALKGENFNANKFAKEAILRGAIAAVVDEKEYEDKENNIFLFENSLVVLQDLARFHRSKLSIPVIGLTGSNGKTTTKELIFSVLKEKYNILHTKGNLNNHIGVPLTVLSIKPEHEMAIIEMGANHKKEIEFLCTISQPNFGYITNFGKAHLEGFGGFEGVIKGKSELYQYIREFKGFVLINNEDEKQIKLSNDLNRKTFNNKGDFNFELIENNNHTIGIKYQDQIINSNLTGKYNFTNICAAISFGFIFDVSFDEAKKGIEKYFPTNHRSQIEKKGNITLVLDTYNANPTSMEASLRNFSEFSGKKTAIIGDMFELGKESAIEHQKISDLIESLKIDIIYLLGSNFFKVKTENFKIIQIESTEKMIDFLKENPIKSGTILLKGSRGMALERLLDYLG